MQQRQMVRLWDEELFARGVALLGAVVGAEEDARHGQHADDRQDLVAATQLCALQQHLCQRRVKRELHHVAAERRQPSGVVKRAEPPQLVHAVEDVVLGRGVHEAKLKDVVNLEALEQQHCVGQVGPLDLRHRHRQHLLPVRALGVQPVRGARSGAPGTPRALPRSRLAHREDLQRVHSHLGIEDLHFDVAGVNDVEDAIYCEAGLGDVCADDDLAAALRRPVEDLCLQVARQRRVDRQDQQLGHGRSGRLHLLDALRQREARCFNLLLARHEDEDVSGGVAQVDGHGLLHGGLNIVFLHRPTP
mmetsp:Transcript_44480/g.133023  ORF Transcript_44480/g.133023 Transcript_44480/m.133023 type:complete len:304 (-) Transcript_44480:1115-2026(-)